VDKEGKTIVKKSKIIPQNREYYCSKWVERLRLPKESNLLTFHVGNANESPSGEKTRINMVMWPGLDRRITRWPRLPFGYKDTSPPDEDWDEVETQKKKVPSFPDSGETPKDNSLDKSRIKFKSPDIIDHSNFMEFLNED
jgi:hypothetical protein